MWRALFLAIGVTLCILGAECLGVHEFILKVRVPAPASQADGIVGSGPAVGPQKKIVPPDYAPWSLMGLGVVVVLYAYDLPRRLHG